MGNLKNRNTRCMQVINETLRMANLTNVMFRKAVNDVEIKGK